MATHRATARLATSPSQLMNVLTCCVRMRTLTLAVVLATIACGPDPGPARERPRRPVYDDIPYQAETEETLGAAVAILIDTSSSMRAPASGGDRRPKYEVAREALEAML